MLQPLFLVGNVYLHVLRPRGHLVSTLGGARRAAQHACSVPHFRPKQRRNTPCRADLTLGEGRMARWLHHPVSASTSGRSCAASSRGTSCVVARQIISCAHRMACTQHGRQEVGSARTEACCAASRRRRTIAASSCAGTPGPQHDCSSCVSDSRPGNAWVSE